MGRSGLAVAALYDLVSAMHDNAAKLEHTPAMAFGDAFKRDGVKSFALADFCGRCGISRADFARGLEALCNSALEHAPHQAQDSVSVEQEGRP